MASRNTVRQFDTQAYYHIYNRGVERRRIFVDDDDYIVFLSMLKRHLDSLVHKDNNRRPYDIYDLELLAFCLMPNHFHLFVYQDEDPQAFTKLLRSVSTAYTKYFNKKYKRVGHLFQDRFKASRITDDSYLQHITRYIHLNSADVNYKRYKWSSLPYYLGDKNVDWIKPQRILDMFVSSEEYANFLDDYSSNKVMLDEIKHELANF